jgi:hypothetical protein
MTSQTSWPVPIIEDTDLIKEAFKAYFKWHKNNGSLDNQIQQPSELFSQVGRKYVEIRNGGDLLAKYDFKKKKIVY